MTQRYNVIIEKGEDGYLISEVVELPGCHTQAKTYDELLKRTKEAIEVMTGQHAEIILESDLRLQYVEKARIMSDEKSIKVGSINELKKRYK